MNDDGSTQKRTPFWDGGHYKAAQFYARTGLGAVVLGTQEENPFGGLQTNQPEITYVQCMLGDNYVYPSPFPNGADVERAREVLNLSRGLSSIGNDVYGQAGEQFDRAYSNAENVLGGNYHSAFSNNVEPLDRTILGHGPYANAAIITRRLIQSGAPFVVMNMGNWDTHSNEVDYLKANNDYYFTGPRGEFITRTEPGLGYQLDNVVDYLQQTVGDQAIIVVFGELGRTPRVNNRGGTDHWGRAMSMLITGPGIEGGVIGATDRNGVDIAQGPVYPLESALEVALNAAGLQRVQINTNNNEIPENPVTFPTQSWLNIPQRTSSLRPEQIYMAREMPNRLPPEAYVVRAA